MIQGMTSFYDKTDAEDFIEHHGVHGMHWGVRRFQNPDGSLTAEGKRHRAARAVNKIAEDVSKTAKKAGEAISTAARKTFNPTSADMDEKIAKAKEKEEVKRKKAELKAIKNNYKNIDQMSDKQVKEEIQSLAERTKLREMREKEAQMKKGNDYIEKQKLKQQQKQQQAQKSNAKSLGTIVAETATYGLSQASKAAIDVAVNKAKQDAMKSEKSKSEKLKDELQDARNENELADLKLKKSMRKTTEQTTKANMEYDKKLAELKKESLSEKDKDKYNDMISRIKTMKMVDVNKPKTN